MVYYPALADNTTITYCTHDNKGINPQGSFFDGDGYPLSISQITNNSITFNGEVHRIGSYAFHNCQNLKSIEIPESIDEIGYFAFSMCQDIDRSIKNSKCFIKMAKTEDTNVTVPDGTITIASGAFRNNTSLTSIILPNSLHTIEESAFAGCVNLKSITIPSNTAEINNCAFWNCTSLKAIYAESITPATINSHTFYGVNKETCLLFVPKNTRNEYKSWGFKNTIELCKNEFGTVEIKAFGTWPAQLLQSISDFVEPETPFVIDLTEVSSVNGNLNIAYPNTLYITSKDPSEIGLTQSYNVITNNVCKNFVIDDNYALAFSQNFVAEQVQYTRATSSNWGTICLPFEIESNNEVQYYTEGYVSGDKLYLTSTDIVPAGHPAIFYRKTNNNLSISKQNTTIKLPLSEDVYSEGSGQASIKMFKTFQPIKLTEEDLYYISQNKFWLKTVGIPLIVKPFRSWFSFGGNNAKPRALNIMEDENSNAIKNHVVTEYNDERYYGVQGQAAEELKKGLNIILLPNGNAQKIIIK